MFVTEAGDDKRFLQRIEASIMQSLYNQPSPHRDILDEDMHFARRRHDEEPITVTHVCASTLYGIPKQLVM
jgi:hypothetical protein